MQKNKEKYYLLGYPLAHSLSPLMFNLSFAEEGIDCEYLTLEINQTQLGEGLRQLKAIPFQGANLTIPLKETIIKECDEISAEAHQAGAVNALWYRSRKLYGFNTDILGFRDSIKKEKLENAKVCLLGAGGAARAILYSLIHFFNPGEIILINRDPHRAIQLSLHFESIPITIKENVADTYQDMDVIINSTPVGMFPDSALSPVPSGAFHQGQVVYDLVYNPLETKMLRDARQSGAEVISGLEMLIQQGKHAFKIWTGKEMPVDLVRETLIGKLKQKRK